MNISQTIAALAKIKAEHGDLDVVTCVNRYIDEDEYSHYDCLASLEVLELGDNIEHAYDVDEEGLIEVSSKVVVL